MSNDVCRWPETETMRVDIEDGESFLLRWDGYGPDVSLSPIEDGRIGDSLVNRGPNALSVLLEALVETATHVKDVDRLGRGYI